MGRNGKKIKWNSEVRVLGKRQVYSLKQHDGNPEKEKKKKYKKKLVVCPNYEPGMSMSQGDAMKLIRYITVKLDFDLLHEVLGDKKFYRSYLTIKHLEIIMGKGLISGEVKNVKKMFKKATNIEQFQELCVSNAYINDLVERRKKNFSERKQYSTLTIMTIIRQGDHETLQFALENLSPDIKLGEVMAQDGDMVFSAWARTRNVKELSPEERLMEAAPKTKIFDTYFEIETPLSAVLKNRESLIEVSATDKESILHLLLKKEADPLENRYHVFKVAARYNLLKEIKAMLSHVNKYGKRKLKNQLPKTFHGIYVTIVSHAATENQQDIIDFIRSQVDKTYLQTKEADLRKSAVPRSQNNQRQPKFPNILKEAITSLVELGKQPTCTYRYRILNGVYNLLNIQQQIAAEEVANIGQAASSKHISLHLPKNGSGMLRMNSDRSLMKAGLVRNEWVRTRDGRLRVNDVVNYNAAYQALSDPDAGGLSSKLNNNLSVNVGGADFETSSVRSYRSASTASSLTVNGKSRKSLIKPQYLHQWLLNILSNNDFNGENMGMVLFSLGLRFYVGKPPKRRKKSDGGESDAGSSWGMDSVASGMETDMEDDDEDDRKRSNRGSDAQSTRSEETESTRFTLSTRKSSKNVEYFRRNNSKEKNENMRRGGKPKSGKSATSKKSRRKSTISAALDFFKEVGANIGEQLNSGSKKMKSKDKVLMLEKAAEFGSQKILSELLTLVAPTVSKSLLKCIYMATSGNKVHTHEMLLQRIVDEYVLIIKEASEEDAREEEASLPSTKSSKRVTGSNRSIRNVYKGSSRSRRNDFIVAVEEFFEELDAADRLRKHQTVNKERRQLKIDGAKAGTKTGQGIRKSLRRASQLMLQNVKIAFNRNGNTGNNTKTQRTNTLRKLRKSITSALGGSTKAETDISRRLKGKKKKPTNLASKMMKQKQKNFEAKRRQSRPEEEVNDPLYENLNRFLLKIFESACLYGHFEMASTTLKNEYIDKKIALKIVVQLLRKCCGPQQSSLVTNRELNSLLLLLKRAFPKKMVAIPDITMQLFNSAIHEDTPSLSNLTFLIQRLTKLNGPFLKQNDLMTILIRSTETAKEWDEWSRVIKLLFDHMVAKEKQDIENINQKIKKKNLTNKLPKPVKRAVNDICNLSGRRDSGFSVDTHGHAKGRRRQSSSLGQMVGRAFSSGQRMRRKVSGSFSGSFSNRR